MTRKTVNPVRVRRCRRIVFSFHISQHRETKRLPTIWSSRSSTTSPTALVLCPPVPLQFLCNRKMKTYRFKSSYVHEDIEDIWHWDIVKLMIPSHPSTGPHLSANPIKRESIWRADFLTVTLYYPH